MRKRRPDWHVGAQADASATGSPVVAAGAATVTVGQVSSLGAACLRWPPERRRGAWCLQLLVATSMANAHIIRAACEIELPARPQAAFSTAACTPWLPRLTLQLSLVTAVEKRKDGEHQQQGLLRILTHLARA